MPEFHLGVSHKRQAQISPKNSEVILDKGDDCREDAQPQSASVLHLTSLIYEFTEICCYAKEY